MTFSLFLRLLGKPCCFLAAGLSTLLIAVYVVLARAGLDNTLFV